jgi:hypothetical protein
VGAVRIQQGSPIILAGRDLGVPLELASLLHATNKMDLLHVIYSYSDIPYLYKAPASIAPTIWLSSALHQNKPSPTFLGLFGRTFSNQTV